jgi:hypothetical protein
VPSPRLIRHGVRVAVRKVVRPRILGLLLLAILIVPLLAILVDKNYWEFRDNDVDRGSYRKTIYLDQNWTPSDSLWFYETTQGSDLLPYDFFLSLESADSDTPLRSLDNVNRWGLLPQHVTTRNPDALPVGFAQDSFDGENYVGLTCAACHTTELDYKGITIRIDGGPSMANVQQFLEDLGASLEAIAPAAGKSECESAKCTRFVAAVLALGHYKSAKRVITNVQTYSNRLAVYNEINRPRSPYGNARLDAFGRIFNRVLQHVVQRDQLSEILPRLYDASELPKVRDTLAPLLDKTRNVGNGPDIDKHVVEYALGLLSAEQQQKLIKGLFNVPDAPVSYPFLWDIPQHDYLQWNGLVANAGLGPVGRNTGEAIGVFATLDWQVKRGFSLAAILSGQGMQKNHISYRSSVRVDNLRRIESQLAKLESPQWSEPYLGQLDSERRGRGEFLFDKYCVRCHSNIDRASPQRRVVANMDSTDLLGTDVTMASNSINAKGYSGLLRNQYAPTVSAGDILIDTRAPVVAQLSKVAVGVIAEPYPGRNIFMRGYDWLQSIYLSYVRNEIHASLKAGSYDADTSVHPYASLQSYKGRSLNGIWATAPYLHNGSVPSLAALLLPKRPDGVAPSRDYRPDVFYVGSREFDPVEVGFQSIQGDERQKFDTALPGNSNSGHEYGTANDPSVKSGALHALNSDERLDLLEYLKSL